MAASTRKAVDLLSMYADDDDDEDQPDLSPPAPAPPRDSSSPPSYDSAPPLTTPYLPSPAATLTPTPTLSTPNPQARKSVAGALGIADYGQDESAMSPEPEDMEIDGYGRVMVGAELELGSSAHSQVQPVGAMVTSPPTDGLQEQCKDEEDVEILNAGSDIEGDHTNESAVDMGESQREVELLAKFMPPPPANLCSEELQEKFNKFLVYQRAGKSFNGNLRNMKEYRNPDFLLHAVTYQRIDQIGTCFAKDVFDPHGYDPSDYYDAIEASMKQEIERKERERKRSPKVEFVHGNVQHVAVISQQRIGGQIPVSASVPAGGLHPGHPLSDPGARDGRHSKKSKWDKV